jgi:hypothetical protein
MKTLKIASSLLGSEENKRIQSLKKKFINSVKLITVLHSYQISKNMDEKLKIKISIADRVYPLTVELNQEEGLRALQKKLML